MGLMDDGWEARMAERTRQRRVRGEVEEAIRRAAAKNELRAAFAHVDPAVYHGWHLKDDGLTVWVGNGIFCAGCGHSNGCFSIAITAEYIAWAKDRPAPDWPFAVADCPAGKAGLHY